MTCIPAFRIALSSLLLCGVAQAQTPGHTALPANHPLIGDWKLEIPNVACDGMLQVRPDGTTRATSAAQVVEAEVDLSPQPAESGYYKLSEKIVRENGQVNCVGNKIKVGQGGTNYLILNRDGDEFLMCAKEDINTCVGPFVRQKGS